MARHYDIEEAKKIIYADILALTEKEEAEIEKYRKYGFSVEPRTKKPAKVVRLDKEYILDYLRKNDEKAVADFMAKMNEPATDEAGKEKLTEKGKVRKKGYNNALHWFARTYPADTTDISKEIKIAGKEKAMAKAYQRYQADNQGAETMTEQEYTRYFYWTKVFVKPAE